MSYDPESEADRLCCKLDDVEKERDEARAELAKYKEAMEREKSPKWSEDLKALAKYLDDYSAAAIDLANHDRNQMRSAARQLRYMADSFTLKANFVPSKLRIAELERLLMACLETGSLRTENTRQLYLDVCKCLNINP